MILRMTEFDATRLVNNQNHDFLDDVNLLIVFHMCNTVCSEILELVSMHLSITIERNGLIL
jgi:hypothetical protein